MSVPRSFFGFLCNFTCYFIMSYNTPLLTNHLINEGFSPSFTGVAMISVSIAFLISSLKIPSFYTKISKRGIIFFGIIL